MPRVFGTESRELIIAGSKLVISIGSVTPCASRRLAHGHEFVYFNSSAELLGEIRIRAYLEVEIKSGSGTGSRQYSPLYATAFPSAQADVLGSLRSCRDLECQHFLYEGHKMRPTLQENSVSERGVSEGDLVEGKRLYLPWAPPGRYTPNYTCCSWSIGFRRSRLHYLPRCWTLISGGHHNPTLNTHIELEGKGVVRQSTHGRKTDTEALRIPFLLLHESQGRFTFFFGAG